MNRSRSSPMRTSFVLIMIVLLGLGPVRAEDVGERWGTEERERDFYPIVNIPLPKDTVI
jgi:hypothetical protein